MKKIIEEMCPLRHPKLRLAYELGWYDAEEFLEERGTANPSFRDEILGSWYYISKKNDSKTINQAAGK